MSIIKDVRCKPPSGYMLRSTYLLEYGHHVARLRRLRRRVPAPAIHAASHVDHVKQEMLGFLFLCMHVVPFPVVMVLRLAALRPPELRYYCMKNLISV